MKLLNKKPTKLFYIVIIIILLLAQPIYFKTHNKISAYKIERVTKDLSLAIEDLNIICMNDGIYIEPDWILRTGSSNKDRITNISLTLSTGNHTILPMNINSDVNTPNKIIYQEYQPIFVPGIKMDNDSVLTITIAYSLHGEPQVYSEDLELKSFEVNILNLNKDMMKYGK